MMPHDGALFDDVAVLALGALSADDAERVMAHVRECPQCHDLYAQLRPAADRLGYAVEEAPGADVLTAARRKKRIMAAVRDLADVEARGRAPARSRVAAVPWTAAAAAIAIAYGLGLQNVGLRQDYVRAERLASSLGRQYAGAVVRKEQRSGLADSLIPLLEPSAKRYAVPHGVVVLSRDHIFMIFRGLDRLPAYRVYQTWTLANGAKKMAPGVTFRPNRNGIAFIELRVNAGNTAAVALSVEPSGGSRQPTTTPRFVRKLT